jgi:hypothetical protein
MATHDAQFYKEYDKKIYRGGNTNNRDDETEMDYFFNTYAHPESWRPVLEKNKKLHLCLAHFGGDGEWGHESMNGWSKKSVPGLLPRGWINSIINLINTYDNVYTDISCLNIYNDTIKAALKRMLCFINNQNPPNYFSKLKDRLIFGSDWYLTYLTPIATPVAACAQYDKYCNEFKNLFNEVDSTGELWEHVSLLNPWECYSLSIKKLENMRSILPVLAREMKVGLKSGIEHETFKKLEILYCDHIKKKLNPKKPCEYESTCRKDPRPCKKQ